MTKTVQVVDRDINRVTLSVSHTQKDREGTAAVRHSDVESNKVHAGS